MVTRFDHAILAVHDLERASAAMERLGLTVRPGGRHPRWGTHNAIARAGLEYLELLAIENRKVAESSGFRRGLLSYLSRGAEGWLGFALATDDADAEAAAMTKGGAAIQGPTAGERRRPDGSLLTWRTVSVGEVFARRELPFLIEHGLRDEQLLGQLRSRGEIEPHALGLQAVRGLVLAVEDLDEATDLFSSTLGLQPTGVEVNAWLGATTVRLCAGRQTIALACPTTRESPVYAELLANGPGTFAVELTVADIDRAVSLVRPAISRAEPFGLGRAVLIVPREIPGARLVLSPERVAARPGV
ncbi:MAG: VOC family protein [Chloroflexi bacterium]|nr:VOC family protein [Chloroflexota bacterium]